MFSPDLIKTTAIRIHNFGQRIIQGKRQFGMDPHPTPFPVKSRVRKLNPMRKILEPPRISVKSGPGIFREKRVFGTTRNPNIPLKPAPEKRVKARTSSGPLRKAAKPLSSETNSTTPALPISGPKSSSERDTTRKQNKSVSFLDTEVDRIRKCSSDGSSIELKTPVRSAAVLAKPRLVTPYLSAEKCSKCRFDKLETSSYWLGQIKLAESVGKHVVSSAFFGLALDCKAEPISNVRVELKKYVGRHDYLNDEEDWKKLFVNYGLVEGGNSMIKENMKASREEEISSAHHNVEEMNLQKENQEESKELNFHDCCSSKHSEKSSPGRPLFD